ncbi:MULTISPECIES: MetQ/NlpA family ABC transporter substrate-binding protein [Enterobacteriaceae]|jgi:D-methionine transport system substrate-binding protein|uniref:MetQ/NlpA family ABC transporter substrate-binding protein n=1 Tax=Enterobacteriaceae TaxID=543 RepID=UPI000E8EA69A|nr:MULTISPECIES: MetQ/NlpA family ABC transporter substrate-binding protein [Enterobacteriaceae]MCR4456358.1 MetQ/NlpA family ABC transporter substrate-binding protein [Pseudescherichia sp. L3]MDF2779521.1 D-methionine transporter, periplasmic D-methionine-binding protein [Enterobacteriaceae bacterium]WPO94466.1 MetQ/NlpA family ABC transporter substrate-binding protein [Buttiauxella sp. HR94]HAZ76686.1 metal ABC transporter substrate-binding protein [Enterobacteriaceae bacterium]
MGRRLSFRASVAALLLACGLPFAHASDPHTITFGVAPGPYGDMVKQAIAPSLKEKGYKVVVREFSDYVQPNMALSNGSIDANLFQHSLYLDKFAADKGLKLTKLIVVPTAGMGLYSHKVTSVDQLKKGDIVTLSNDPTNLARGLRFLQAMQLITIKENIDPTKASERDIASNPKGLVFKPLEAAQLPRTLDSASAALVNGNFAIAAGLKLSSALKQEQLDENLKNVIAVRTEDADKPFAKDIVAAVQSPAYRAVIDDPKNIFNAFQKPEWMHD